MSYPNSRFAITCALIALCSSTAFAETALNSGQNTSLSLGAGTVSSNYYIDVDGSAKALTVALNGSGGDLDVFVRYGTPFPEQATNASFPTVDETMLNHYAHYRSISSTSTESLTVLPDNRYPLKAGRWYISVVNGALSGTGAGTLSATVSTTTPVGSITLDFQHPSTDSSDPTNDCDDSFWTDTTAATPVGGNPGTTLGDQRKNALTYASQQLVTQLGNPGADHRSRMRCALGRRQQIRGSRACRPHDVYVRYTGFGDEFPTEKIHVVSGRFVSALERLEPVQRHGRGLR